MSNSIDPEAQKQMFELRTHSSETQHWIGEVELVKETKKTPRYLLLTDCCLYLIKKKENEYKISKKESIFDLLLGTTNEQEVTLHFHSIQFTGGITSAIHSSNSNNPNLKISTINKRIYIFNFSEGDAFLEKIYTVFRNIMWNVNLNVIRDLSDISDPRYIEIKRKSKPHEEIDRPKNILLHRYIAASISKDAPVEKEATELAISYDSHPTKSIKLSNFNLTTPIPLLFVLTMEPNIRSIVLDNFSPSILGIVLSWVFSCSSKFLSVTLKNYQTGVFKALQNRRSPYNECNTLFFIHCSSDFIQYFMTGFRNVSYSITTLVLQDMKLSDTVTPLLLKTLQTFTFASKLETLSFVDLQSELPLFEFFVQLLKNRENAPLKQLVVENCGIDVCQLLSQIGSLCTSVDSSSSDLSSEGDSSNELRLQVLSLRRNYGRYVFGRDDSIPMSILHLNVGDCEWSTECLSAFLHTLCRWKRPLPFALEIDHARVNSWNTVFSHLPVEGLRSVITELNMSNNVMDAACFEQFLAFLATQSLLLTNSPSKLMYLNLSSCFVDKISDCMTQLLRFFLMREIWGLSLCDIITPANADVMDKLLNQLSDVQGLVSLDIRGNFVQESASQLLLRFVRDSSSIAELAFDRCGIENVDQLLYLYESLLLSPHIIAFQKPIDDIKSVSHRNETKRIGNLLKLKCKKSAINERISLYLTLFGNFSTRLVSPIISIPEAPPSEVEEKPQAAAPPRPKVPGPLPPKPSAAPQAGPVVTFTIGKKVPRAIFNIGSDQGIVFDPERACNELKLYENIFKNPVNNLFRKYVNKTTCDASDDPLASVVSENIVTGGKFGIVPPTVPPLKPPVNKFELPSIFATMQNLPDGAESSANNINEGSMEFINLQSKLSSILLEENVSFMKGNVKQNNDQVISIFSGGVARVNPKSVLTIPSSEINFNVEKK